MNRNNMENAYLSMINHLEDIHLHEEAMNSWKEISTEEKFFWIFTFNTFINTRVSDIHDELRKERDVNNISSFMSEETKQNTKFKNFYMLMSLGLKELWKSTDEMAGHSNEQWIDCWKEFNSNSKVRKRMLFEHFIFRLGFKEMERIFRKKQISAAFSIEYGTFHFQQKNPHLKLLISDINSTLIFPSDSDKEKEYFKVIFGFDYEEEMNNAFKMKRILNQYFEKIGYKDGMPIAIPIKLIMINDSLKNTFNRMCLEVKNLKMHEIGMGYKNPIIRIDDIIFTSPNTVQLYINNLFNAVSLAEFVEPISDLNKTNKFCETISRKYKSKNLVSDIQNTFKNILNGFEYSIEIDVDEKIWNKNIKKANGVGDIDLLIKIPKEKIVISIESKWLKPNFNIERELNKGNNRKRNISKWKKRTKVIFKEFKEDYKGWEWINLFISSKPHGQFDVEYGNIISLGQLKKWEDKPGLQGIELSKINKIQL